MDKARKCYFDNVPVNILLSSALIQIYIWVEIKQCENVTSISDSNKNMEE